jgi:hypothetical protein
METQRIIGTGIAASAIAHLSVLTLVILLSEVHPFGSVTAEPITVDLVSPEELKSALDQQEPLTIPKITPFDSFNLGSQSASPPPAAPAAAGPPPAQPQQQAAPATPGSNRQQANAWSQPPSPQPAYIPPEPDPTVKYHVLLGLPVGLPADRPSGISPDDVEAPASIAPGPIKEFRRHLRTCSKLPAAVASSDQFEIKVRVLMTPEGRLAAKPTGIEGPGNAKGPALIQSAIAALQACQPYTMLPVQRYSEWKVLDLVFTPRDFVGG